MQEIKHRFKLTLIANGDIHIGESVDDCLHRAIAARSRSDNIDYYERGDEVMREEKAWAVLQNGVWVNIDPVDVDPEK